MSEEATKYDVGKPRPELIAPEMIEALGTILGFGAVKYAARNWEKGMDWSRCYGALLRHLNAWWSGEDLDPETGESHLWHASCCLMFLVAYESRGAGNDDRSRIVSDKLSVHLSEGVPTEKCDTQPVATDSTDISSDGVVRSSGDRFSSYNLDFKQYGRVVGPND